MGMDITVVAQRRTARGWEEVRGPFADGPSPFSWRSYGMFGFLADARNHSCSPVIAEARGAPDDLDEADRETFDYLIYVSWLRVDELAAFDYDQVFEDRRCARQEAPNIVNCAATSEAGQGELTTLRDFLGQSFFDDLQLLKTLGAERIVFGFDS